MRRLRAIGLAGCVCNLMAAVAPALAAAGETAHGEHHPPGVGDLMLPAVNFAIYLYIIVRYLIPAMREYLRRRRETIVEEVQASRAALDAAERALADAKRRIAALPAEARSVCADLVAAATRRAERVRTLADENGKRRVADAALVAQQERQRELQTVRAEVAAVAAATAEHRIRAALSSADQVAFVRQLLEEVAVP